MRLLGLVFLLLAFAASAQPTDPLPPLRRALAAASTDSAQGRLCWAMSELSDGLDSTAYYAKRATTHLALALARPTAPAERRRLQSLLGGAFNNLALGNDEGGNRSRAEPLYRRAIAWRTQAGDVRGQLESLWNLGTLYQGRRDYVQALRCMQQGVKAGTGVPAARSELAQCLGSVGLLLGLMGDARAPLTYQLRALAMLKQGGEPRLLINTLNLVADTYRAQYRDTARAEAYSRQAQALAEATPGTTDLLTITLTNRAILRLEQHRLAPARAFLLDAQRLAQANHSTIRLAEIHQRLAELEEAADHLPQALHYAQLTAAPAGRNTVQHLRDAEETLSRLYEKMAQPQAALVHYRRYVVLRDSTNNERNKREALQQHLRQEYAQQTARLRAAQAQHQAVAAAEIRRQKLLRTATSLGALLLLGLAGVLYNRFRFQRRATATITREKARSDELLLNILPAEVAEELKDTGQNTARLFEVVTVLFADVVDFTQLSETLTPQQLVATLDTYFRAFDAIVDAHGLEKIKTIGDAYMLAGGLGQGAADPASVVRAALAMHAVTDTLRAERQPQGLPCFALRIGLHTGPVVAGVVGVRKFAYDIWGDTVNTAARMESAGAAGRVNISEATYRLVADRFACTPRGKLVAKHKGEMEMYFVEGEAQ